MAVKIPPEIKRDLAQRDLVIWHASHPITFDYEAPGGKAPRGREDKNRVTLELSGPGLGDFTPMGFGTTVQEAVDHALNNVHLRALLPGLTGAMARLERELSAAALCMAIYRCGDDVDDDIPF